MSEDDFDRFIELLDGTISMNPNWKPIPPVGKALFFKAMEPYTLDQVSAAMTAHVRDPKVGMFQPTPAHLIAQIQSNAGNDGRPTADEAWAIALTSLDESDTVVWTAETAEAFALCRSVLNMGDKVGARRSFIDAYERLVAAAREAGKAASWNVSLGWDQTKREAVLQKAEITGLLPAPTVTALLPNGMRSADGDNGTYPEGLKLVKQALAQLQDGWQKNLEARAAENEAKRLEEQQRKNEIAAKVEAYQRGSA